jgi:hypothetical protein
MKTCPDCGSRVYNLGCTWCNEPAYIEEQIQIDGRNGYGTRPSSMDHGGGPFDKDGIEGPNSPVTREVGSP